MPQKRQKNISILFIRDDKETPVSFTLKLRTFRVILVFLSIVALFNILGITLYGRITKIYLDYEALKRDNIRLVNENKRIYTIVKEFSQMKRMNERIRTTLGAKLAENKIEEKKIETVSSNTVTEISDIEEEDNYYNFLQYIPFRTPVSGFITREFEKAQDISISPKHTGVDIAAKEGTIIRASASGTVIFADWTYEGGNTIIIYHGRGYFTIYEHNQRLLCFHGKYVKQSEAIALLGSSGETSSGPHLHFEIWKDGIPIDPREYIAKF
jgi:murein DD-endopeptidase MepM/ murein hydrolase activator NlpD